MASDHLWGDIRDAIVTLAATVTELRQATGTRARMPGPSTSFKVLLPPRVEITSQPMAWVEEYTLTFRCELTIPQPGGSDRADEEAMRIGRGLQQAWWTGHRLGLATLVIRSGITSFEPGLEELEGTGQAGYTCAVVVECREVLAAARTA